MTEHRLLTGASLHEPKGCETATSGQVYVANGTGGGTWTDKLSGIQNLNIYATAGRIPDISNPGDSFFHVMPFKAQLTKLYVAYGGTITTANSVLTLYKNGIAQTPTFSVPFAGSGAGVVWYSLVTPNLSVNENDVLEVRTDGGSSVTFPAYVTLRFTVVP